MATRTVSRPSAIGIASHGVDVKKVASLSVRRDLEVDKADEPVCMTDVENDKIGDQTLTQAAFTETLHVTDSEGFQTVVSRSTKRALALVSDGAAAPQTPAKRREINSDDSFRHVVLFKGVEYNLAAQIRRRPLAYQADVANICGDATDTADWRLIGDSLSIVVKNTRCYDSLLRTVELCGKSVIVSSDPRVTQHHPQIAEGNFPSPISSDYARATAQGMNLGVIYAVPCEFTLEQVRIIASAVEARRLSPLVENEEVFTALLTFNGLLPRFVHFTSLVKLKVFPYVLRPMQCKRCWAYGHTHTRCLRQAVCEYCSRRGHVRAECPVFGQSHLSRCVNCKGSHPASSKLCGFYQENLGILKFASSRNPPLSFREARDLYYSERQPLLPPSEGRVAEACVRPVVTSLPVVPSSEAVQSSPTVNLQYKELEALTFSHKVLLMLHEASVRRANPNLADQDPVINALHMASSGVDYVMAQHDLHFEGFLPLILAGLQAAAVVPDGNSQDDTVSLFSSVSTVPLTAFCKPEENKSSADVPIRVDGDASSPLPLPVSIQGQEGPFIESPFPPQMDLGAYAPPALFNQTLRPVQDIVQPAEMQKSFCQTQLLGNASQPVPQASDSSSVLPLSQVGNYFKFKGFRRPLRVS